MNSLLAKMESDVALLNIKGIEEMLNGALEKKDLKTAKIFKRQLSKALKDYYGI